MKTTCRHNCDKDALYTVGTQKGKVRRMKQRTLTLPGWLAPLGQWLTVRPQWIEMLVRLGVIR
jgi:hypothetical protein